MISTYETIPVKTRCDETSGEVNPLRPLAELGRLVLDRCIVTYDAKGIDPDDLHDEAIDLGLIEAVTATQACEDDCECARIIGGFPHVCLRLTDKAKVLDANV